MYYTSLLLDPPDQRSLEPTHNSVTLQQGQPDLQGELDDNIDIHSDPPDQVQEDPHDDHRDDQGASSHPSNALSK